MPPFGTNMHLSRGFYLWMDASCYWYFPTTVGLTWYNRNDAFRANHCQTHTHTHTHALMAATVMADAGHVARDLQTLVILHRFPFELLRRRRRRRRWSARRR